MTLNSYDDNLELWAANVNALLNADADEGFISGVVPSKGSGDWDLNTTSGEVIAGGPSNRADVTQNSATLTDPASDADMDAGESRIDLVTVDNAGTVSVTEGTAAADPASPDIPAGEALAAVVHIAESDTTLADSDIYDARSLIEVVDGTTPTDVAGSRSRDTWFQNTDGTTRFVYVAYSEDAEWEVAVHINTTQSDNEIIRFGGETTTSNLANGVVFPVADNDSYKISSEITPSGFPGGGEFWQEGSLY